MTVTDDRRTPTWPYASIAIGSTVFGLVVVGYLATTRWLDPTDPLILVGVGLGALLWCLNGLAVVYYRSDQQLSSMLKRPLKWTMPAWMFGMAVAGLWTSGTVRGRILETLPDQGGRTTQMAALEDPSTSVATRACRAIVVSGPGLDRQTLLARLERRPPVATRCLSGLAEGTSSSSKRALELSRVLQNRWMRRATSEASKGERVACRRLAPVVEMPGRGATGVPALLSCAIGDSPDALQKCCTEHLIESVGGGKALGRELDGAIEGERARELVAPLIRASIHRVQLSQSEKSRYSKLALTHPSIQRFALRLACDFIVADDSASRLINQLNAWLDRDHCLGGAEALRDNREEWSALCRDAIDSLERADQPARAICSLAGEHLVDIAVHRARSEVHGAVSGGIRSMWESGIQSGTRRLQSAKSSPEAFKRAMEQLRKRGAGQANYRAFVESMEGLDSNRALSRFNENWSEALKSKGDGETKVDVLLDIAQSEDGLNRLQKGTGISGEGREGLEEARERMKQLREEEDMEEALEKTRDIMRKEDR